MKETVNVYNGVMRFLHWGMALLMVLMVVVAYTMMGMENSPNKWFLYGLHKSTGITILFLAVVRFLYRQMVAIPGSPKSLSPLMQKMAKLAHLGLYGLMMALPLSGYVMSVAGGHGVQYYNLFALPNLIAENKALAGLAHEGHEILAYILYVFFALHVLGALYHHFILKDDVMARMVPGLKK